MRLAQLARKIAVKPAEIVEFLAVNHVEIEVSSNAKVSDEYVGMVLKHFAPELLKREEAQSTERIDDDAEVTELPAAPIDSEVISDEVELTESSYEPAPSSSNEIIKPPKVELPGLKVVGKIDLPELRKKKDETPEREADGDAADPGPAKSQVRERREDRRKGFFNNENRRPRKNPLALQREREEREALRRKLEAKKKEKELRTQRYLKKVSDKAAQPKPSRKSKKQEEEYEVYNEAKQPPKSLLGKLVRWFVSE